jgi:proline iminopeptidase
MSAQVSDNIIVDENMIHYKTFGKGTPVLIINGGPGFSSEGFIPLAKSIGESQRAIIYDQRGTGQSTIAKIDRSTITLDLMVEDIERIRQHLEIDEWVVMGHSFGGMLASYYATKHPQVISGLILSSSGGIDLSLLSGASFMDRLTPNQQDSLTYWTNQINIGDTTFHAKYQRGKNLAPAYLYDKSHIETIAQRLTQGDMNLNSLVWQDMRQINFDCKEELKSFHKPVLIIQGREDVISKDIAEIAHGILSESELVFIPECAHYGWLEQPEAYFNSVGRFLNQFKQ